MAQTKYPKSIMQCVRQNLWLEIDDTSEDDRIENMSRHEVLSRVAEWNGLIDYGGTIRSWIQSIGYSAIKVETV